MPLSRSRAAQGLIAVALSLQACGPSVSEEAVRLGSSLQAPSQIAFPDVADALQKRCATLDCHGQAGRNLRLYGYGGLRLSQADTPIGIPTTDLEYKASYDSVVGLEPEIMSEVVQLRADVNQLTMIRKIRGIEHHKGGQLVIEGNAFDRCIVLWLTNRPDPSPCLEIANAPIPGTQ
ncbi:MAG: hypothetical protein ABIQ16_18570 [Polyangiaceae bacterium]